MGLWLHLDQSMFEQKGISMSETPKPDQNQGLDISTVLNNPQIQKLYVNRIAVGNTISDMFEPPAKVTINDELVLSVGPS